jgi:riboflavin kinase/FMN adenylyltransferase
MLIQGIVVPGKQEARTLGYPTANIEYSSSDSVKSGVWTCWIMVEGKRYQGVAVIGMWRLASGEPSLEVHILDFSQEIYRQVVEVEIGTFLRPLEKFESIDQLKEQIQLDIERAREQFSR